MARRGNETTRAFRVARADTALASPPAIPADCVATDQTAMMPDTYHLSIQLTGVDVGTMADCLNVLSDELEALALQAALAGDLDRARALLRAAEL